MKIKQLSTVAFHAMTDASNATVSTIVIQVEGITADSGSMVPMQRISMSGVPGTAPTRRNCIYTNKDTGAPVAAGTAITADGTYEFNANGCEIYMNVTAVTAGFTCYITPLEGPSGSGGGGGGVSEAVTIADGADVTLGAKADAAQTDWTQIASLMSIAKGQESWLSTINTSVSAVPTAPLAVVPQNAAGTISQPTADAVGREQYVRLADGTLALLLNPASTAAVATLASIPVALHPSSPLPTGSNFLGTLGGTTTSVSPALAVTASAYAANQCMGGKLTLTGALRTGGPLTGAFSKLTLRWHGASPPVLSCLLFKDNPAATFTDQATFPTLSAADDALVSVIVPILSTDWITVGSSSFCTKVIGAPSVTGVATTLYAAFNVTSGTPTPGATTDLSATFGFFAD